MDQGTSPGISLPAIPLQEENPYGTSLKPGTCILVGVLHAIGMFESANLDAEELYFSENRTWLVSGRYA